MKETHAFNRGLSKAVLIGSILFVGVLLALSLMGISDPKPYGELAISMSETEALTASERTTVSNTVPFAPPGSLRSEINFIEGSDTTLYGVAWGGDGITQFLLVTPSGYLTVVEERNGERIILRPLGHFIHVRADVNSFQIDITAEETTLWLNDERVMTLAPIPVSDGGAILKAGDASAVISIESLEVFKE